MARKPMHPLKAKEQRRNALFIVPMACLAVLLVALPLIYVAGMAFTTTDGRVTLDNFKGILRVDYLMVFVNSLKLCTLAVSLGADMTLIEHPASMTHTTYTIEALEAIGIGESLLRLAVGLENAEDLIADLKAELDKIEVK